MSFPTVQSVTETTTSSQTTHSISMPATVNANDLLVILVTNNDINIDTDPSGWTVLRSSVQTPVYIKAAAGTEGGGSADIGTSSSADIAAQVYRITGWFNSGTILNDVELATTTGSGTTPDPPSLNPTNWATEETLWLAVVTTATATGNTINGYPSSYTNGTATVTGGATAAHVGSARRGNSTAAEDPGTFSTTGTISWRCHTIGIRPAPDQNLTAPLVTLTPTIFAAEFLANTMIAPLFDASPTIFSAGFVYDQNLTAPLFSNTPTFYAPTFAPGSVSVTAPLVDLTPTIFAHNLAFDQNITAPLVTISPTFYGGRFFTLWSDVDSLTAGSWSDVDIPG